MVRAAVTALALLIALPAAAQQLSLDIRDGLVTLQATNVPVPAISATRTSQNAALSASRCPGALEF